MLIFSWTGPKPSYLDPNTFRNLILSGAHHYAPEPITLMKRMQYLFGECSYLLENADPFPSNLKIPVKFSEVPNSFPLEFQSANTPSCD